MPSFKVAWNQKAPEKILISSQQNEALVISVSDNYKNLSIDMRYPHVDAGFGVAWSPSVERFFITACKDAKIRLFDTMSAQPNPVRVFSGHTDRIYNVLYNPLLPNIFVSGSDDRSIRVWDINQDHNSSV